MVAVRTAPPSVSGNGATSVPPSFMLCRGGPLDLHSFPTRRSSDLSRRAPEPPPGARRRRPAARSAAPRRGTATATRRRRPRSEEHTSELQSRRELVCRLLPEKKKSARGVSEPYADRSKVAERTAPP